MFCFCLQIWRLATTFLFFGTIGFNFLFNMIFTYRYCRMLEEGSFRGRTADFFFMFVFGGALMLVSFYIYLKMCCWLSIKRDILFLRPSNYFRGIFLLHNLFQLVAPFLSLPFLGQAFTIMLVYVWSRRNPFIRMNFFGLLNFHAPYLPWVLLLFSVLLNNSIILDIMGKTSFYS